MSTVHRSPEVHEAVTRLAPSAGQDRRVMEAAQREEVIRAGRLEVRPGEFLVLADGRPIPLSVRELGVLVALARRVDRIVARADLYRLVWDADLRPGDRSVDVYVRKLRVKLEQALPDSRFIHTHVGFGYRFSPERSHLLHTARM